MYIATVCNAILSVEFAEDEKMEWKRANRLESGWDVNLILLYPREQHNLTVLDTTNKPNSNNSFFLAKMERGVGD